MFELTHLTPIESPRAVIESRLAHNLCRISVSLSRRDISPAAILFRFSETCDLLGDM